MLPGSTANVPPVRAALEQSSMELTLSLSIICEGGKRRSASSVRVQDQGQQRDPMAMISAGKNGSAFRARTIRAAGRWSGGGRAPQCGSGGGAVDALLYLVCGELSRAGLWFWGC